MSFSYFTIKLHKQFLSKCIAIDKMNHPFCAANQHLFTSVDISNLSDVFDLESEVVFELTVAEVEKFDKLFEHNSEMKIERIHCDLDGLFKESVAQ